MNMTERPGLGDLVAERLPVGQDEFVERRRANRLAEVSPQLLPLLRSGGTIDLTNEDVQGDVGATPMLGILIAAALSVPLWCGVILVAQAVIG